MFTKLHAVPQAHEDGVWAVSWTEQTNRIVTGGVDERVNVWNGEDYSRLHRLADHKLGVVSVATASNGQTAASCSVDSIINVWDLERGTRVRQLDPGPAGMAASAWKLAFSPDGALLLTGTHSGALNLWSVEDGAIRTSFATKGRFVMAVAYSANGKYIAAGSENGAIFVYDVESQKLLHKLEGHVMAVRSLAFSPDSKLLATASDDGRINLYDVAHANLINSFAGHSSWVLSVAFGNLNRLASGVTMGCVWPHSSNDRKVKIWDLTARQCLHTFDDHTDQVWGVAYNGSATKLATVSEDRSMNVFQVS